MNSIKQSGATQDKTVAEAVLSTWKTDEKIRREFQNNLSTFAAYVQNKGDEGLALVGLEPKDQPRAVKSFNEHAAVQTWQHDPALREEFNGNKDVYLAFVKADARGQVRILGRKTEQG